MTDDEGDQNEVENMNEDELLYEKGPHLWPEEDEDENEAEDIKFPQNKNGENDNQNEAENENENEGENEQEPFDENDSNTDNRFPEEAKTGWIKWFCDRDGHNFLVEISDSFLSKKSNLIGIKFQPYLSTILSKENPQDPSMNEESLELYQKTKECYGLIHRRFIRSPEGLALVREKYLNEEYGHCPRQLCEKQFLLPIGISDDLKYSRVKVFCPLCEEVYKPDRRLYNDLDGAFFGTGYPQFFMLAYPDLNPRLKTYKKYVPRLYGFKIVGKNGSKYYDKDKNKLKENLKKLGI